uniref:Uncharacterized protein n=1 Tax=Sus scrofa TaxID=9823 RepID=A0A8D1GUL8_PIG
MIMGNCSTFLIERNKQMKSSKSSNLKTHNSFCYHELIHGKAVGVELAASGESVLTVLKQRQANKSQPPPVCGPPSTRRPWGTLSSIVHMTHTNKYCPDLHVVANGRAGTILGSQK